METILGASMRKILIKRNSLHIVYLLRLQYIKWLGLMNGCGDEDVSILVVIRQPGESPIT